MVREREKRNGFNGVVGLVATCVLFFYIFSYQVTRNKLFFPQEPSYGESESIVHFESQDGTKLVAFWGPVEGAKWTVVYFHGNAEDIGDIQSILRSYQLQGLNILCMDYRGFGLSEGKAVEENTFEDANALLDYAIEHLGVDVSRIVLHGRSIGGGVAMELATKRPAAGLILESSFLSIFQMYLPVQWLPGDKFVNSAKAAEVACPALVIHGREDHVVPFKHGEKLASLISEDLVKTLWVDAVGHNDLVLKEGRLYWAAIRNYITSLKAVQPAP